MTKETVLLRHGFYDSKPTNLTIINSANLTWKPAESFAGFVFKLPEERISVISRFLGLYLNLFN